MVQSGSEQRKGVDPHRNDCTKDPGPGHCLHCGIHCADRRLRMDCHPHTGPNRLHAADPGRIFSRGRTGRQARDAGRSGLSVAGRRGRTGVLRVQRGPGGSCQPQRRVFDRFFILRAADVGHGKAAGNQAVDAGVEYGAGTVGVLCFRHHLVYDRLSHGR